MLTVLDARSCWEQGAPPGDTVPLAWACHLPLAVCAWDPKESLRPSVFHRLKDCPWGCRGTGIQEGAVIACFFLVFSSVLFFIGCPASGEGERFG